MVGYQNALLGEKQFLIYFVELTELFFGLVNALKEFVAVLWCRKVLFKSRTFSVEAENHRKRRSGVKCFSGCGREREKSQVSADKTANSKLVLSKMKFPKMFIHQKIKSFKRKFDAKTHVRWNVSLPRQKNQQLAIHVQFSSPIISHYECKFASSIDWISISLEICACLVISCYTTSVVGQVLHSESLYLYQPSDYRCSLKRL
jgi:hypothetical protein